MYIPLLLEERMRGKCYLGGGIFPLIQPPAVEFVNTAVQQLV